MPLVRFRSVSKFVSGALAGSLCWASVASAAPEAPAAPDNASTNSAPDVELEKSVALLRLQPLPAEGRLAGAAAQTANELREGIKAALVAQEYAVTSVALSLTDVGKQMKCDPSEVECIASFGRRLASDPNAKADFLVYGTVSARADGASVVTLHSFAVPQEKVVDSLTVTMLPDDLLVSTAVTFGVGRGLDRVRDPEPTDEETAVLAQLDEPEKTAEELEAERQALAEAAASVEAGSVELDESGEIVVDLRRDFKDFCRDGKRRRRASLSDAKDVRPACKRGPFFGYWQPRSWAALALTGGAAIAAIGVYGAALAARSDYKQASDDVDAYIASVGGDPAIDPYVVDDGGDTYAALAEEVSRTGDVMRQRAIVGDALLGTTVVLAAILAVVVSQDRREAKRYIEEEKSLRAIEAKNRRIKGFRAAPIVTRTEAGAGFGFSF